MSEPVIETMDVEALSDFDDEMHDETLDSAEVFYCIVNCRT
jgi:hypothetical protein